MTSLSSVQTMQTILTQIQHCAHLAFSPLFHTGMVFSSSPAKKEILALYFPFTVQLSRLLQQTDAIGAEWSQALQGADHAMEEEAALLYRQLTDSYLAFRDQIGRILDQTDEATYQADASFSATSFLQAATKIEYSAKVFETQLQTTFLSRT